MERAEELEYSRSLVIAALIMSGDRGLKEKTVADLLGVTRSTGFGP